MKAIISDKWILCLECGAKTQSIRNSCPASFLAKNEDKAAVIKKYS